MLARQRPLDRTQPNVDPTIVLDVIEPAESRLGGRIAIMIAMRLSAWHVLLLLCCFGSLTAIGVTLLVVFLRRRQ